MSKIVQENKEDDEEEEEEEEEERREATNTLTTATLNPQIANPSFDRLKPRINSNTSSSHIQNNKRKNTSVPIDDEDDPGNLVIEKKFKGSKQEYLKLRNLVPALNERDDISKVEIIEETIRYIDALHHQLAAKNSSLAHSSPPCPEDSIPSTSSVPLQNLEESQHHLNHRSRKPSLVPSSSSRSSSQDVKAAVENIQAMFAAYLDQKNDANS